MKSVTWVLLADSSRALLYSVGTETKAWTLVKEYTHAASRVSEGGLTTDQPGRTHGSVAQGARSAMESKTSPKDVEFGRFANELAGVLHDGHGQNAYNRIVLVAPPHFLGLLRKAINDTVSKLIVETFDKDYLHLSEKEMRAHLDPLI
ncbi:MAG: host attachment protein [Panacagrimonas sp.]